MIQNPESADGPLRPARVGFVTIGQSPRDDIIPEMLAWVGMPVDVVEFGALDGLSSGEIKGLAPAKDERRLVSRLTDGSEAVLSRARVHERVETLLEGADRLGLDAIVLLCTGRFPALRLQTPFVSAQAAVDHGTAALTADGAALGMLVPHEEQAREAERLAPHVKASHATPYGEERFEEAARELDGTDLIVMHCMGYDGSMLQRVRRESGRPTILARRLVASALRQLL